MNQQEEKIFTFKTNINCGGCIAKVSPILDTTKGIKSWSVETGNPNKVLTIISNGIAEQEIIGLVQDSGFNIETIDC